MPSDVVCLKLCHGSRSAWKTSSASCKVEADGSGNERDEFSRFYILLSGDRSTGIRACKCGCAQDHCLQPETLYMCQIIGHEELIQDSLRWFYLDVSPSSLETKGLMRVKDSVNKKSFVLFINIKACMVELKDESRLSPEQREPNDFNTVWRFDQGINSTVAFYFHITHGENTGCYFFIQDGTGKKIVLQKSTYEKRLNYSIWSIEP